MSFQKTVSSVVWICTTWNPSGLQIKNFSKNYISNNSHYGKSKHLQSVENMQWKSILMKIAKRFTNKASKSKINKQFNNNTYHTINSEKNCKRKCVLK